MLRAVATHVAELASLGLFLAMVALWSAALALPIPA
jgi:hypothetical protein